jgi:hypothetical protein
MKAGFFLGGVSIEISADIFEPTQHLMNLAFAGSFENHMFNKMGKSFFSGQFITRAGIDHYSQMAYQPV